MKIKWKDRTARQLAQALSQFHQGYRDQFLCPTCLKPVHVDDRHNITEAHIVPEAAGGRLATLLCRRCNSDFGARQDQWLGEYLRLFQRPNPTFLDAHRQEKYFFVDDRRVSGKLSIKEDDNIECLIYRDHSPPESIRAIDA